jgi:hypothetical protein
MLQELFKVLFSLLGEYAGVIVNPDSFVVRNILFSLRKGFTNEQK